MAHQWKDIDFIITAVKIENNVISLVKIRNLCESGKKVGPEKIIPRQFIVDLLNLKNKNKHIIFYTSTLNLLKTEWIRGDEVTLYNDKFITTNGNATARDNLDNLPRF